MSRPYVLTLARSAGYHRDAMALARLVAEAGANERVLRDEYAAGERDYWQGVPCSCYRCRPDSGNSWARIRPRAPAVV